MPLSFLIRVKSRVHAAVIWWLGLPFSVGFVNEWPVSLSSTSELGENGISLLMPSPFVMCVWCRRRLSTHSIAFTVSGHNIHSP